MRLAVDIGGTFTDLVVEDEAGRLAIFKSSTTPHDPIEAVLAVLDRASEDLGQARRELLQESELFVHATTRATNAILTGTTARTALLTTKGHPDILLFREGGRSGAFDFTREYPSPYVPRALTYEVPERIGAEGDIVSPLDEQGVLEIIEDLRAAEVEAVAVCLLWSIVNAKHEVRVGELIEEHLPGVPLTLSHRLSPAIREYRRASATSIDASLKPIMTAYLRRLEATLRDAGFGGRLLVVTASGGVLDGEVLAEAPIHSLGSGPAMAPVAGRHFAATDAGAETAVVADAGGTSYDVSLVRRGEIPWTRETWLGQPYFSHMTGFPSVDVKSIGAGGGSIAWVDDGGLLHIGPESAGAVPGPVCYGLGGTSPTVTDACLVLGYIDPTYFLGGRMTLDMDAARAALDECVGKPLELPVVDAAAAVLRLVTEHMARAIEEITLTQGVDPRSAVIVAGGGAAGLNAVAIAKRLGATRVVIPEVAAALSAAGALMSDLSTDVAVTFLTSTSDFDVHGVNSLLASLGVRCEQFVNGPGLGAFESSIEFSVEARYPHQVWELEVPIATKAFSGADDVEALRLAFHAKHIEVFAINDPESAVEFVSWRARARCRLRRPQAPGSEQQNHGSERTAKRDVYFPRYGVVEARVVRFESMRQGVRLDGPVIIESPVTTVVVEPGASVDRCPSGSLLITPFDRESDTGRVSISADRRSRK